MYFSIHTFKGFFVKFLLILLSILVSVVLNSIFGFILKRMKSILSRRVMMIVKLVIRFVVIIACVLSCVVVLDFKLSGDGVTGLLIIVLTYLLKDMLTSLQSLLLIIFTNKMNIGDVVCVTHNYITTCGEIVEINLTNTIILSKFSSRVLTVVPNSVFLTEVSFIITSARELEGTYNIKIKDDGNNVYLGIRAGQFKDVTEELLTSMRVDCNAKNENPDIKFNVVN